MNADVWSVIAHAADFDTVKSLRLLQKYLIPLDVLVDARARQRLRDHRLIDFMTHENGDLDPEAMHSLVSADARAWTTCVYLFSDDGQSYFSADAKASANLTDFMQATTRKSHLRPSCSIPISDLFFDETPPKMCERVIVAHHPGDDKRLTVYRIAGHRRLWSEASAAIDRLAFKKAGAKRAMCSAREPPGALDPSAVGS